MGNNRQRLSKMMINVKIGAINDESRNEELRQLSVKERKQKMLEIYL